MTERQSKTYMFIFDREMGGDFTLRVNRADDTLTPAQVGTAIQKIMASNAIRDRGSLLKGFNKAYIERVHEYETLFVD